MNPVGPRAIYWTETELGRLHLHFYHPIDGKHFNLFRRVRPEGTPATALENLTDISAGCDTFQVLHTPPFGFHLSLPEERLRFNTEVAIDLVWLYSKLVPHVIDTHTCYQTAAFINEKTASGACEIFVEVWVSVHCG